MSRAGRGPVIALPPDTDVEEAFHQLVSAAVDQPRPTPALRSALNKTLELIGHPLHSGKSVESRNPQASQSEAA